MGAHYTGACMGMPHALHAISAWRALLVMAPLALAGAALASHRVEHTVGSGLLTGPGLAVPGLVIVIGVAFALTSAFNLVRIPTSTIQILVFTVVGVGLATRVGVHWSTIGTLAVVWAAAPVGAAGLGYALTRLLDRAPVPPVPGAASAAGLVGVGALASFAMGGNDVANATGALVGSGTFGPLTAGLIGGLGLAAGVLTWGRPLLHKVAFDIVTVDRSMATAAQLVQAAVVLVAVAFGYFTSMNQAPVGAMSGAGVAHGRRTVHADALRAILLGWLVGPGAGVAIGYLLGLLVAAGAGSPALAAR
ncbi:MAG: inorganic phosphate transporter [Jatrophihabitans sp.]|nr:MAG: inorganic phosphate transporter [Jatrophihabitans sp.]